MSFTSKKLMTTGSDNIPDAFDFTNVTGANPNAYAYSNTVTITGITTALVSVELDTAEYTVNNAVEFSINGGAYTSTPSIIKNNETLRLRYLTEDDFSLYAQWIVTVGQVTDTWRVTLRAVDTTGGFTGAFTPVLDAEADTYYYSPTITVTGLEPNYTFTATATAVGDSNQIFRNTGEGVAVATYPTTPSSYGTSRSAATDGAGRLNIRARARNDYWDFTVTTRASVANLSFDFSVTTNAGPDVNAVITPSLPDPKTATATNTDTASGQFTISGLDPNTAYYASYSIFEDSMLIEVNGASSYNSVNFTTDANGEATGELTIRSAFYNNMSKRFNLRIGSNNKSATAGYYRVLSPTSATFSGGANSQTLSTAGAYTTPRKFEYTNSGNALIQLNVEPYHSAYGGFSPSADSIQLSTDGVNFVDATSGVIKADYRGSAPNTYTVWLRAKAPATSGTAQWYVRFQSVYDNNTYSENDDGSVYVATRLWESSQTVTLL